MGFENKFAHCELIERAEPSTCHNRTLLILWWSDPSPKRRLISLPMQQTIHDWKGKSNIRAPGLWDFALGSSSSEIMPAGRAPPQIQLVYRISPFHTCHMDSAASVRLKPPLYQTAITDGISPVGSISPKLIINQIELFLKRINNNNNH